MTAKHATALRRFGTAEPVSASRMLRAGDLSASFSGGGLRDIRWRGVEIIRAVAFRSAGPELEHP